MPVSGLPSATTGTSASASPAPSAYLDSDPVFIDIYVNEQTVEPERQQQDAHLVLCVRFSAVCNFNAELARQEQNAHQVQSVRFSAGCNFNTEFGCQCD